MRGLTTHATVGRIVDSPEKGASKEKQSPEDPPSGLSAAAAMNHSDPNEFDEDDDDELRGGLFSLDEEQPKLGTGKTPKRYNCDYESDAEDESDELRSGGTSATGRVAESSGGGGTHTGALAYGTSLPVTIPAGRFWPPKDAVDSIKERDGLLSSDDENTEDRSKTLLPQRIHKDLYREMQAQARSIQAADDPERLFGERPQRRRYQTGEASPVTPRPLAPHAPHDNAIVIVAASVSSHT
ncbi:hypothetical protein Tcan_03731 [Toxocara canis]|uniref:Uncharacterized protein n=1 Tax=Toxocara canis TaxID=6265 RepID=A0A0B2UYY9_TOXCA|nr:hypothetical protein Tcan_03731 [Toxocara canis]